jgi:autotransporter-associated beta strand protein
LVTFQGNGDISVSGAVSNGTGGGSLGVIKSGTGTLAFSGPNTYSGDTTINQGIIAVANPVLADTAAVRIAEDGTLHLSHGTTDTVDRLFIDGVEQFIGTWGGLASSATHKTSRITGSFALSGSNGLPGKGFLQVSVTQP